MVEPVIARMAVAAEYTLVLPKLIIEYLKIAFEQWTYASLMVAVMKMIGLNEQ